MRPVLPYAMFDLEKSANQAKRLARAEKIYHRGQELAWDGHAVLAELVKKHGTPRIEGEKRLAARRVLGSIMWGELAAWKIAAQLADEMLPLEARMAATSQAHDEARHFYVMHDYLLLATGDFPREVPRPNERLIAGALAAETVAKKLLGMQLQLESTALTIFHALREARICPVLSELLVYYEKDEARHVGLGTQLLPTLMARMSVRERIDFSAYSFKMIALSIGSLKGSEPDLRVLGVDPRRVVILGKSKQTLVLEELWSNAPALKSRIGEALGRGFDGIAEVLWPTPGSEGSLRDRTRFIVRALREGYETGATSLDPTDPPQAIPKG